MDDKLLENLETQLDEKIYKLKQEITKAELTAEGYWFDWDVGTCIEKWEKIVTSGQSIAAQLFIGPYWGKAGMLMTMAIHRCRIEWSERLLKKGGHSPERLEKIKRNLKDDKEDLKIAFEKVKDKIKDLKAQGKIDAANYMTRYANAILTAKIPGGRS